MSNIDVFQPFGENHKESDFSSVSEILGSNQIVDLRQWWLDIDNQRERMPQ